MNSAVNSLPIKVQSLQCA